MDEVVARTQEKGWGFLPGQVDDVVVVTVVVFAFCCCHCHNKASAKRRVLLFPVSSIGEVGVIQENGNGVFAILDRVLCVAGKKKGGFVQGMTKLQVGKSVNAAVRCVVGVNRADTHGKG